jgi:glutamate dehydrogenase/leucine dehydrogenase
MGCCWVSCLNPTQDSDGTVWKNGVVKEKIYAIMEIIQHQYRQIR